MATNQLVLADVYLFMYILLFKNVLFFSLSYKSCYMQLCDSRDIGRTSRVGTSLKSLLYNLRLTSQKNLPALGTKSLSLAQAPYVICFWGCGPVSFLHKSKVEIFLALAPLSIGGTGR